VKSAELECRPSVAAGIWCRSRENVRTHTSGMPEPATILPRRDGLVNRKPYQSRGAFSGVPRE
jgi:hypothetical protein